jgi:LPS sulfotransferase NodH
MGGRVHLYTHHKLDHDFGGGVEIRVAYLVCALPRSGSSLLCELLFGTGQAGAPAEYFDPATMDRFRDRWEAESLASYVTALRERRTGPNGVFGMKAHFFQLAETFRDGDLESRFPGLRYVYISRRDRLRQAISWARAIQTNRWAWTEEAATAADPAPIFRRPQVDRLLAGIAERERRWEAFFIGCDAEPLRVTYEELVEAPAVTVAAVLRHLGIPDADGVPVAAPALRRQADELTEEWVSRYLEGEPVGV